jgi:hypothetical protein
VKAMKSGRNLVFAIPGDPGTQSGGHEYDRRVIEGLKTLGWSVEHLVLPPGFPTPSHKELAETGARRSAIADGSLVMIDGRAFGAMHDIARAEANRLRMVALVHHPLALETGLAQAEAARLVKSEQAALKAAQRIVLTRPVPARQDKSFPTGRQLSALFPQLWRI